MREKKRHRESKQTHGNLSQLSLSSFNVDFQGTCNIIQLFCNENRMEMLTKYIILVDSAIPLSEKQCFLTFSITRSYCMHEAQTQPYSRNKETEKKAAEQMKTTLRTNIQLETK